MQSSTPKQFQHICDRPILIHTITPFLSEKRVAEIIIVVAAEQLEKTKKLCRNAFAGETRLRFVCGGRRRQDSVFAGITAARSPLVMVHDAARPMISAALIARCCTALKEQKAFVVAVPVVDTIKRAAEGMVEATVDRQQLFRAQTPQGASRAVFLEAFAKIKDTDVTDESSLFEKAGISVYLLEGEESNFKITRQEDLQMAEMLLAQRQNRVGGEEAEEKPKASLPCLSRLPRIGHGFDAHRLVEGRKLILGGVEIPFERGLAGHSDADVLIHALCDALLGAIGAGDIGRFFPDNDQKFKNICSLVLLEDIAQKVDNKGFYLVNADITLVCQQPKIAPYLEMMKEKLCAVWQQFPNWPEVAGGGSFINIKATTEEQMGYTGRSEGVCCHAVVLLAPQPLQR